MNLIFIKFFYVLELYPPHEIILKISNNISMNLKKIINNIHFIIKMYENHRQGMRLIVASRYMI